MARACQCFAAIVLASFLRGRDVLSLIEGAEDVDPQGGTTMICVNLEIKMTTGTSEYSVEICPTLDEMRTQPRPVIIREEVRVIIGCYLGTNEPGTTRRFSSGVLEMLGGRGYPELMRDAFNDCAPESQLETGMDTQISKVYEEALEVERERKHLSSPFTSRGGRGAKAILATYEEDGRIAFRESIIKGVMSDMDMCITQEHEHL
jgi:hypothetical protein